MTIKHSPMAALRSPICGLVLSVALGLVAATVPAPAGAATLDGSVRAAGAMQRVSDEAQSGISVEQATRIVRNAYGGRVVSASRARRGTESGYRIRVVLDDGRVLNVFVDSQGRIR